ncbi:unnamed protein product [Arctia plantaginis]|uniref:ATP synthase F1 subunit epsilon n=1 Tax=Arctia plantaginis TaxID=874455 RepID=A0A8S1A5X2_ARCPL|nr:unnamed protein product [Arctia plantaginis]
MNSLARSCKTFPRALVVRMYSGEPGSGAGRGGGGGGSIREAGGAFGKMEAGREEAYFYEKQKQQIEDMKKHLHDEIAHHRDAIKRHEDAINRTKKKMSEFEAKKVT